MLAENCRNTSIFEIKVHGAFLGNAVFNSTITTANNKT